MGMLKEFKEFAMRGNLVDIAVAFVMGAAFGKIVTSFVDGIIMPLIGMLLGGVDYSNKKWVLKPASAEVVSPDGTIVPAIAEVSVKYGAFITNILDFIIVAFAVFLVIKAINSMKKPVVVAVVGPSSEEVLLTEIRDLLKK
jgi:large conductance mechanosensitive channel